MPTVALFLVAIVVALGGCAGPRMDVAPMPQRDADLYPWAETQDGVVVAVDEILEPVRVRQYFGAGLLEQGVLPVSVIVSNRSDARVTLGPDDVLLVQGREVIDPLPIARVARIVERAGGIDDDAGEAGEHLANLALRQTTLAPNESYQGVLFFPYRGTAREPARDGDALRTILRLFEQGLQMNVGLTEASTGARLHFGPFRLVAGKDGWRSVFDSLPPGKSRSSEVPGNMNGY